jgi:hypothetical protein
VELWIRRDNLIMKEENNNTKKIKHGCGGKSINMKSKCR